MSPQRHGNSRLYEACKDSPTRGRTLTTSATEQIKVSLHKAYRFSGGVVKGGRHTRLTATRRRLLKTSAMRCWLYQNAYVPKRFPSNNVVFNNLRRGARVRTADTRPLVEIPVKIAMRLFSGISRGSRLNLRAAAHGNCNSVSRMAWAFKTIPSPSDLRDSPLS